MDILNPVSGYHEEHRIHSVVVARAVNLRTQEAEAVGLCV